MTDEELKRLMSAEPSWMKSGLFGPLTPVIYNEGPRFSIHRDGGSSPPTTMSKEFRIIREKDPIEDAFPTMDSPSSPAAGCSYGNVNIVVNGTQPTDLGYGSPRPLRLLKSDWMIEVDSVIEFPNSPQLSAHTANLDVTPGCSFAAEVTDSTGITVLKTIGCFATSLSQSYSGSGSDTTNEGCDACPPDCQNRQEQWGASGAIDEFLDLGDIAIQEASLDLATYVYVRYSFAAEAGWECAIGPCAGGEDCIDPATGIQCGPAGSSSSGLVCCNYLGMGDPASPPAGTTSSVPVRNDYLSLFFGAPSGACLGTFTVTYGP
jgi:hypothetical protein